MKTVHEFKAERHEQGQQQKQTGSYAESLSEYFHSKIAVVALGKDQLRTFEATDATLQFCYIVRFELHERFDFIPGHRLKSPVVGP
jgi:hypothetical protein